MIIKDSAEVQRITRLAEGDVYKRVEKTYAGAELKFGVVQSIMGNGSDGAFTALEFTAAYGTTVTVDLRIFATTMTDDLVLFPAAPEEVAVHLQEVIKTAQQQVKDAEQAAQRKRLVLDQVYRVEDLVGHGRVQTPAFSSTAAHAEIEG